MTEATVTQRFLDKYQQGLKMTQPIDHYTIWHKGDVILACPIGAVLVACGYVGDLRGTVDNHYVLEHTGTDLSQKTNEPFSGNNIPVYLWAAITDAVDFCTATREEVYEWLTTLPRTP